MTEGGSGNRKKGGVDSGFWMVYNMAELIFSRKRQLFIKF